MVLPQDLTQITATSASQVKELARLGKGTINQVAWAPHSNQLAIATSFGIYREDAATLERVHFMPSASAVVNLAFGPDEKSLVSGSAEDLLELWPVSYGTLAHASKGHTDQTLAVAFSPDGKLLNSGSTDGTIRFWGVAP